LKSRQYCQLGAISPYFDFAAQRDLFASGLTHVSILHVATHALLDMPEPADLASLVFSRYAADGSSMDGYLRAYEIRRLDLPADLVVLSACSTALGENVRGEGWVGLSHAFFAAGATQVVASLWNINDRETAKLMDRFYGGLGRGLSASRALRDAQAATWNDKSTQAPHFWAGFIVQGDWTAEISVGPR
jgi:CHAT domain-containing protein